MKREQLILVIERADQIIRKLSIKYAHQKEYLVFSSHYGQCNVSSDVKEILADFPEMIVESIDKKKAIELTKTIKSLERQKKDVNPNHSSPDISSKIDSERCSLKPILDNLEILEDTFIEIRFAQPNLDLIFEMQKDPLVSQKHTPHTKASIKIVLGTLGELSNPESEEK